ncbi:MAG: hypothetical protein MJ061_05315, partial [Mailhella sp.]|nr:hypothetical protein [Mailhella sp.]
MNSGPAGAQLPAPLACLRLIAGGSSDSEALQAAFSEENALLCASDPLQAVLRAAALLGMAPELCPGEVPAEYAGPLVTECPAGHWLVIGDASCLNTAAVIFRSPESPDTYGQMPVEEYAARKTGRTVVFRSLGAAKAKPHSGITCLSLIGRHHHLDMDERRLIHDYDAGDGEPSTHLLEEICDDFGLRCRTTRFPWDKAVNLGPAYPAMGRKKDGSWFILGGIREEQPAGEGLPGAVTLAVIDPSPAADDDSPTQGFHRFWSRETYERLADGTGMLLQRRYKMTDEEQPFGLRWFIPEFIKLRGIFGQITLAVVMMTLLSLLMPLFFQIVIDKVLPNSSFTTLNVLGVGITLAILFNAGLEFLRNYLLLFATQKIDINTAMKTFSHLMRLPVQFFDAVPSGLLIKHMQQTEKIRGFLSGNLFFTVLDLFSLVIFIPFLMLYSVSLTGVVLFFSFLMAVVIMVLIKPFQRRLDTLYRAEGKRQSRLVESLHGIHTVKALALEPVEEKGWNDATAYSVQSHFNVGKISLSARTLSQMLEMLMNVSVIWLGAHLVFDHVISIGALIAFQMLSGRVSGPLVRLVGLVHEYQQTALSVKMLGAVMNTPIEHPGGGVRQPVRGGISMEHVSFRYAENLPDVLHDFSIDIRPGETIGIVG